MLVLLAPQVAELTDHKADEITLTKEDKETELPDAATIADHEIEDDSVVYFTLAGEKPEVTPFGSVGEGDGAAAGGAGGS